MPNERVHSTEGELEGRELIGGLIRNIEEDPGTISDSFPLRWEIQTVRELARWIALNLLTSIRTSVIPRGLRIRQASLLKHNFVQNGSWLQIMSSAQPDTVTVPPWLALLMHIYIYSGLCGYCVTVWLRHLRLEARRAKDGSRNSNLSKVPTS